MSIATRIESIEEHIGNAYYGLESIGADLTDVDKNIDNIASVLDDIYDDLPKVTDEDTSITLDNTRVGRLATTLKGNTSQTGTPTPSSPIDVNVVSGDNSIGICGKNLLEITSTNYLSHCTYVSGANTNQYKLLCTASDMYVNNVSNAGVKYTKNIHGNLINCEYGETIYFDTGNSLFGKTFLNEFDSNYVSLGYYQKNTSSGSYTPTNQNCKYVTFRFGYGTGATTGTTYTLAPIISKSSDALYEPYNNNTYNIDLPVENLLDLSQLQTQTISDVTITKNSDSSITLNGTASANITFDIPITTIDLKANQTYTLSQRNKKSSNAYNISLRKQDTSIILSGSSLAGDNMSRNITTTTDITAYYLRFYITSETAFSDYTIYPILEKGNKNNGFSPYGTTPIELCKIGNYQDYFYKDSDKWYLHKEIGEVVFNGSVEFTYTNGVFYKNNILSYTKNQDIYCDYYTYGGSATNTTTAYSNGNNTISSNSNDGTSIYFRNDSITSKNDFTTWLTANKPVLYYVLATSTDIEITYQPLIDQLNLLEKAMSKDGQTNISQVNNDLPFILSVSALSKGV